MNPQFELEESLRERSQYFLEILKLYSCPDSCQGYCCQKNRITCTNTERIKILNKYPDKADIFFNQTKTTTQEIRGITWKQFEFTSFPCPMLKENNLCSIHASKPIICQLYPFSSPKNAEMPELYALDPCPMGINIVLDYSLFKALSIVKLIPDQKDARIRIMSMLKMTIKVTKKSKNFIVKDRTTSLFIPISESYVFYRFLLECPQEILLESREFLLSIKDIREMKTWMRHVVGNNNNTDL